MANPIISSASLSKAIYAPGETMTLTVTYSDPDNQAVTVTTTLTDSDGNTSAPVTSTAVIKDSVSVAVVEAGKTWAKVSDNGTIAVFQRVA